VSHHSLAKRLLATLCALTATATTAVVLGSPAEAATSRRIAYTQWASGADFADGRFAGTRVVRGQLRLAEPVGSGRYVDPHGGPTKTYSFGRWTSPWTGPGFGVTELIASWDARVRKDAWVQLQVRGATSTGRRTSWDTLARWAPGDRGFHRTSAGPQADDLASVATDTWRSDSTEGFTHWQLRVTLFGRSGTDATPFVDTVGAMGSRLPDVDSVGTSRPGVARGITLDVPKYSQMIHRGEYPQWGGGGQAWCSPTSTSMVLGYYGRLPEDRTYAWVDRSLTDRFVDHAARMTYDYEYGGTGNWPFNTAYAAARTGHAFVTRLRQLREAERFIKAGIPVVASLSFSRGELDGAPISATNGHLVVIVGFTRAGDVVVNDPAAGQSRWVRRVYDRGQFENAWLPRSGGLAYIIRTNEQELPLRHGARNW